MAISQHRTSVLFILFIRRTGWLWIYTSRTTEGRPSSWRSSWSHFYPAGLAPFRGLVPLGWRNLVPILPMAHPLGGGSYIYIVRGLGLWCWMPLSTIFQLYRVGQFSWRGENRSTRRKSPIFHKSLTNCLIIYTSPWAGFELTTLVVIGTDCTGSCKSNYHTTTTAPSL